MSATTKERDLLVMGTGRPTTSTKRTVVFAVVDVLNGNVYDSMRVYSSKKKAMEEVRTRNRARFANDRWCCVRLEVL